ncbi:MULTISPECIES: hypothetical protein [Bacillus cereus group]|uniref:hypothetical protein n=1 Tax=Bacillus cereus group TaxID=86661 RepID=UPI001162A6A9|nr:MULTISPECIES: hypothetical protein [Bacillus cereus group]QDD85817.1 hypothetical protein FORC087_4526 [Bacillus cereus]
MSIQQELALFEEQVEREHAINRRIEVAKMRRQGKRLGVRRYQLPERNTTERQRRLA